MGGAMMDELFKERIGIEDGVIYRELVQPSRLLVLERNQAMRNAGGPKDLSFGRWQLCIPLEDLAVLKQRNLELGARDNATRTKAWQRFVASPESLPYRVGKT